MRRSSFSYLHGLQIPSDLHRNHLLVPGGSQVPLDVQLEIDWFQQFRGWSGFVIDAGSAGKTTVVESHLN